MNLLSMLSNFGAIKEKAPQMLAEFLDHLLEENKPLLRADQGEVQIFYLLTPIKNATKPDYNISIVALSEDNRILRIIKRMPLSEAVESILKQMPI